MALNNIDKFFSFYEKYPDAFASAPQYVSGNANTRTATIEFTLASNYVISAYTQDENVRTAANDVGNPGGTYRMYCSTTETGLVNTVSGANAKFVNGRGNSSFTVAKRTTSAPNPQSFRAQSASKSVNRSVTVFDFNEGGASIEPNQYGEQYFRLKFTGNNGNNALTNFEVSEVMFFDENYDKDQDLNWNLENALISNVVNTEVVGSSNFKNVQNVVDGGTVYLNEFAPAPYQTEYLVDGVNYDSDASDYSEASVTGSPVYAHIDFRVRGGTRTVNKVDRFIPSDSIVGDALVTDPSGFVAGVFEIPDPNQAGNPAFETGERQFRLSSDPNNGEVGVETFAQALYTATGILETRQESFTATRNGRLETREVTENIEVTRLRDLGEVVTGWWDPVAQSILPSTPGGEFVTKIDVFFSQKDSAIPVTMQIREMENGIPTRRVLPGASKTLFPEDVKTSRYADQATTFTFDTPVYLKEGVEVAIVLMTDSDKYLCWISRMGELDVTESRNVSEQPYLGVLFKSQNNSTWTAYDYEDLKFTVYRAWFDTTVNAEVVLQNVELPMKRLNSDPIETYAGSNQLKVHHSDHQMYDAERNVVSIKGVSSGISSTLATGVTGTGINLTCTLDGFEGFPVDTDVHTFLIKSKDPLEQNDEVVRGTVEDDDGTYTITITLRGIQGSINAHAAGSIVELYEDNGFTLDKINTTHDIVAAGMDYYVVEAEAGTADVDNFMGGANVYASENALIDSYQLMVPSLTFPDTSISTDIKFTTGTSASGTQASFGNTNAFETSLVDRNDVRQPLLIASKPNEDNSLQGDKSATVTFTMSTAVNNLSPVLDLERKSITTYANRMDNIINETNVFPSSSYVSPTQPEGDSGEAVYITKRVQLENPATAISVYLDMIRNAGTDVQVMYKVLRSDDSTDFDDISWTYFNETGGPDTLVPAVADRTSFKEYNYTVENVPEFISFAIKIKMNGTNSSEPPLIKNLRAIALAR